MCPLSVLPVTCVLIGGPTAIIDDLPATGWSIDTAQSLGDTCPTAHADERVSNLALPLMLYTPKMTTTNRSRDSSSRPTKSCWPPA